MKKFHPRTRALLTLPAVGLAPREVRALDLPPIHHLPDKPSGFGLAGNTGIGKTFALARHLAERVESVVCASSDPETALIPSNHRIRWINWPEKSEEIKRLVMRSGDVLDDWVFAVKWAAHLYLDDLGRERCKGDDDYSLALLTEILDHRYRNGLPVYWTSNRMPDELCSYYPSRLTSRLLSTWPPYVLYGKDLRLANLNRPTDFKASASGDQ